MKMPQLTGRAANRGAGFRRICFARACVALAMLAASVAPSHAQRETRVLPGASSRAPIQIEAENLEFVDGANKAESNKSSQIVYSGNVVAKQGDSTLKSPKLTILLAEPPVSPAAGKAPEAAPAANGPSSGRVRRMEATGPVTVSSKDQTGRGDRGVYDKAENKVYLIGNVSLARGTQITRGGRASRLVYHLDSGHAEIFGGVHTIYTPGPDGAAKKKK